LEGIRGLEIPKDYQDIFVTIPIEKWYSVADDFIKIVKSLIKVKI